VDSPERRAALSSVYAVMAFVAVPFLVFVVPRVYQSLHPADSVIDVRFQLQMPPPILITFLASLLGFTLLFLWMFKLERRIDLILNKQPED
jgi:heme exporter protein C